MLHTRLISSATARGSSLTGRETSVVLIAIPNTVAAAWLRDYREVCFSIPGIFRLLFLWLMCKKGDCVTRAVLSQLEGNTLTAHPLEEKFPGRKRFASF